MVKIRGYYRDPVDNGIMYVDFNGSKNDVIRLEKYRINNPTTIQKQKAAKGLGLKQRLYIILGKKR